MPKYMVLLHDSPEAFASVSPQQMQAVIEKYMAWGEKLRASGTMLAGEKLADEPGKVMRGKPGNIRVTDGPYSEAKEVLGGYYIVQADTYEKAVVCCSTKATRRGRATISFAWICAPRRCDSPGSSPAMPTLPHLRRMRRSR